MNQNNNHSKWSVQYDQCQRCGKVDKQHHAGGLCHTCYFKEYRSKNPELIAEVKKRYEKKNKGAISEYQKKYRAKKKEEEAMQPYKNRQPAGDVSETTDGIKGLLGREA